MGNPIHGGPRRLSDDAYGLLPHEAAILEQTDAGVEPGAVARALGVSLATVMKVAERYSFGLKAQEQRERLIRVGTRNLLAAIRATGGKFA